MKQATSRGWRERLGAETRRHGAPPADAYLAGLNTPGLSLCAQSGNRKSGGGGGSSSSTTTTVGFATTNGAYGVVWPSLDGASADSDENDASAGSHAFFYTTTSAQSLGRRKMPARASARPGSLAALVARVRDEDASARARAEAARALQHVAHAHPNQASTIARADGALAALVALVSGGAGDEGAAAAAGALRALAEGGGLDGGGSEMEAHVDAARRALGALLRRGGEVARVAAAASLWRLQWQRARASAGAGADELANGALRALAVAAQDGSERGQAQAARALWNAADAGAGAGAAVAGADGVLRALVALALRPAPGVAHRGGGGGSRGACGAAVAVARCMCGQCGPRVARCSPPWGVTAQPPPARHRFMPPTSTAEEWRLEAQRAATGALRSLAWRSGQNAAAIERAAVELKREAIDPGRSADRDLVFRYASLSFR
eukprot:g6473.t1